MTTCELIENEREDGHHPLMIGVPCKSSKIAITNRLKQDHGSTKKDNGLSSKFSSRRTSFSMSGDDEKPTSLLLTQDKATISDEVRVEREARSIAIEKAYVHDVYDQISKYSSDTNLRLRPRVKQFVEELEPSSLVCDVGCGSGKYMGLNPDVFFVGTDRCGNLSLSAREKEHEVLQSDNLNLPFRESSFDAVLSVAVIHHIATSERRVRALRELSRIMRIGGRVLISVWAMEQKHRKFESQDILVPWHKPHGDSRVNGEAGSRKSSHSSRSSCKRATTTCTSEDDVTHYHVYTQTTSDSATSFGSSIKSGFRRRTRSNRHNRSGRSFDPTDLTQNFQPTQQSSSDLSSPNESCYSFVRRAIQKLSTNKRGPGVSSLVEGLSGYDARRFGWSSISILRSGNLEMENELSESFEEEEKFNSEDVKFHLQTKELSEQEDSGDDDSSGNSTGLPPIELRNLEDDNLTSIEAEVIDESSKNLSETQNKRRNFHFYKSTKSLDEYGSESIQHKDHRRLSTVSHMEDRKINEMSMKPLGGIIGEIKNSLSASLRSIDASFKSSSLSSISSGRSNVSNNDTITDSATSYINQNQHPSVEIFSSTTSNIDRSVWNRLESIGYKEKEKLKMSQNMDCKPVMKAIKEVNENNLSENSTPINSPNQPVEIHKITKSTSKPSDVIKNRQNFLFTSLEEFEVIDQGNDTKLEKTSITSFDEIKRQIRSLPEFSAASTLSKTNQEQQTPSTRNKQIRRFSKQFSFNDEFLNCDRYKANAEMRRKLSKQISLPDNLSDRPFSVRRFERLRNGVSLLRTTEETIDEVNEEEENIDDMSSDGTELRATINRMWQKWKSEALPLTATNNIEQAPSFTQKRGFNIPSLEIKKLNVPHLLNEVDGQTRRSVFQRRKESYSPKQGLTESDSSIRCHLLDTVDIKERERKHSDTSSKDSGSIQSDTSLDSEDSCISVIFVPRHSISDVMQNKQRTGSNSSESSELSNASCTEGPPSPGCQLPSPIMTNGVVQCKSPKSKLDKLRMGYDKWKKEDAISFFPKVEHLFGGDQVTSRLEKIDERNTDTESEDDNSCFVTTQINASVAANKLVNTEVVMTQYTEKDDKNVPTNGLSMLQKRLSKKKSFEMEDIHAQANHHKNQYQRQKTTLKPNTSPELAFSKKDSPYCLLNYPIVRHHPLFAKRHKPEQIRRRSIQTVLLGKNGRIVNCPNESETSENEIFNPELDDLDSDDNDDRQSSFEDDIFSAETSNSSVPVFIQNSESSETISDDVTSTPRTATSRTTSFPPTVIITNISSDENDHDEVLLTLSEKEEELLEEEVMQLVKKVDIKKQSLTKLLDENKFILSNLRHKTETAFKSDENESSSKEAPNNLGVTSKGSPLCPKAAKSDYDLAIKGKEEVANDETNNLNKKNSTKSKISSGGLKITPKSNDCSVDKDSRNEIVSSPSLLNKRIASPNRDDSLESNSTSTKSSSKQCSDTSSSHRVSTISISSNISSEISFGNTSGSSCYLASMSSVDFDDKASSAFSFSDIDNHKSLLKRKDSNSSDFMDIGRSRIGTETSLENNSVLENPNYCASSGDDCAFEDEILAVKHNEETNNNVFGPVSSEDEDSNGSEEEGRGSNRITHHRYYHVFREGELDYLINSFVDNLHIINSYYDHASWCIVAEKINVWTI